MSHLIGGPSRYYDERLIGPLAESRIDRSAGQNGSLYLNKIGEFKTYNPTNGEFLNPICDDEGFAEYNVKFGQLLRGLRTQLAEAEKKREKNIQGIRSRRVILDNILAKLQLVGVADESP